MVCGGSSVICFSRSNICKRLVLPELFAPKNPVNGASFISSDFLHDLKLCAKPCNHTLPPLALRCIIIVDNVKNSCIQDVFVDWKVCYGRYLFINPRTPMTIDATSEWIISLNRPWSALFRVSPHAVICLFSDPEITSFIRRHALDHVKKV